MERTVWAVSSVTSGTGVWNRAERPSKTTTNLDFLPRQWNDDSVEKVLPVIRKNRSLTVREVAEEVGIRKSSCHLILTEKRKMASCCRKICDASADASLLIHQFLTKHETTAVPQTPYYPDLDPADLFFVPEVEILTKRSPISDGRGDKNKFDTGPSRRPAKHVPGRVPEMEKNWEWCIKSGEEYFEGDNFD